jgi:NADH-quinone oxidoreductase subunit L
MNFLYSLSPTALEVVATIGALTAFFAATIGLVQTDIKRVLAYSTVSQLGYMFLALGVGAYAAPVFHLMTHAFFKALLFLGSGSVIHGMGGEQDIRKMGGLKKHMPITHLTFLIGTLAIAGVPGLSGFFSKDEILLNAFASEHGHPVLWLIGVAAAGLTAFYMVRLLILTFYGECRADAEVQHHIHESPTSMTFPLVTLAILSVIGGYVGLPAFLGGNRFAHFLEPVLGGHASHPSVGLEVGLMVASVAVAAAGMAIAYWMYVVNPAFPARLAEQARGLYQLLLNKYFVDEAYDAAIVRPTVGLSDWLWKLFDVRVVDGLVNGTAAMVAASSRQWRRWQTGDVQQYAFSFLVGAVLILGWLVLR